MPVKVLVVGDDSFTFTPCLLENLSQWKSKVNLRACSGNAGRDNTSGSEDDDEEDWLIEVTSCLPAEKIPQEFVADHSNLKCRNIPIHYYVNPALLRQYFVPAPNNNMNSSQQQPSSSATHHPPRSKDGISVPTGPPYDLLLYVLPGIQFEGCPSMIPKISDLFKLRLHLFMFSLTKSATVIARPDGLIMFLWVDQQKILYSQPKGCSNAEVVFTASIEDQAGPNPPTQTLDLLAGNPSSAYRTVLEYPAVPMVAGSGQLPFPLVDWEKLGPFCQVLRSPTEDFKLNLNWGEYKQRWKPIIFNLISIKFPDFLEDLKTYCFRNTAIPKFQPQYPKGSVTSWSAKDESTFLRIPSQVCEWDRTVLPHVNDLFHFELRTNRPGEVMHVAKLSVKYDPRVSGWRNTGVGATARHQANEQCGVMPQQVPVGHGPVSSGAYQNSLTQGTGVRDGSVNGYGEDMRISGGSHHQQHHLMGEYKNSEFGGHQIYGNRMGPVSSRDLREGDMASLGGVSASIPAESPVAQRMNRKVTHYNDYYSSLPNAQGSGSFTRGGDIPPSMDIPSRPPTGGMPCLLESWDTADAYNNTRVRAPSSSGAEYHGHHVSHGHHGGHHNNGDAYSRNGQDYMGPSSQRGPASVQSNIGYSSVVGGGYARCRYQPYGEAEPSSSGFEGRKGGFHSYYGDNQPTSNPYTEQHHQTTTDQSLRPSRGGYVQEGSAAQQYSSTGRSGGNPASYLHWGDTNGGESNNNVYQQQSPSAHRHQSSAERPESTSSAEQHGSRLPPQQQQY